MKWGYKYCCLADVSLCEIFSTMIVNSLAVSSFSSCLSCLPKYLLTEMLEVTVIWRTCFTLWWHHYWRISLWKSIPILLRFIRTGSINRKQKPVLPGNNDCYFLFLRNALCITLHLIWGGNCICFFLSSLLWWYMSSLVKLLNECCCVDL